MKEIHDNIERVSVNKIFKNHWNPNEMAPDLFEKERKEAFRDARVIDPTAYLE